MEMTASLKLYSLRFEEQRTWLFAALFVAGNILLPQLFHLLPEGGLRWLPIYFFTLVGAYKYGWRVGLLTALLSPLANSLLFGMPAVTMLPILLVKSSLLALAAGACAALSQRASLGMLALVVALYQGVGLLVEWALTGSLQVALQDLTLGLPGIALQIFGGWAVINLLIRK